MNHNISQNYVATQPYNGNTGEDVGGRNFKFIAKGDTTCSNQTGYVSINNSIVVAKQPQRKRR